MRGVLRRRQAGRRRRAVVVMHLAAHREQPAVGVDRDFEVPILLALVVGGGEALAAVLDPFDRRAEQHGRRRHHQLLRIERVLRPEAAADMRRDHAHLAFGEAERVDDDALGLVRHLGAVPDREQVLGGVEAREHGAGLDRMAAALVDAEALRDAVRGAARRRARRRRTSAPIAQGDCRRSRAAPSARRRASAATGSVTAGSSS